MKIIFSLPLLVLRGVGRAILSIFNIAIALLFVGGLTAAVANYTMTQGSGTTFASVVISTVHYAAQVICDATTGTAQCATVTPGGSLQIDTPASGNLYTAVTAAIPVNKNGTPAAATGSTVGTTETISAVNVDVNWNAVANTALANYGSAPGSVPAVPVNAALPSITLAAPLFTTPVGGTLALGQTYVSGTTAAMTGTSATQVIALVASKRLYITRVKCNNSSGTATLVQITDGSGGTVLDTLAAGATYGGEQAVGTTPLFWTTAGNGLYAQDVTTGASVICTASGYSG